MGLFSRKKEETNPCRCGGGCAPENGAGTERAAAADVKVLGSGCAKCNALEAAVRSALEELGMDPAIDHVTDFGRIAAYGVMTTPALVVEGQVVSCGRVLSKAEAKAAIQRAMRR